MLFILLKRKKTAGFADMQLTSFSFKAIEETPCYSIAIRQLPLIEQSFK